MDSLTQIVLGAAVGEAILGKKIGNKAPLWGAALATVPDLDVIPGLFMDPLNYIFFHRGFSHSMAFFILSSPLFGWLLHKIYRKESPTWWNWTVFSFWALFTHALLDCFTSWGTQLFWPFEYRVAWNTIFIVDPLYTVPFLISVIWLMFCKRDSAMRKKVNYAGLIISTSYLMLTVVNKEIVNGAFEASLSKQKIKYEQFSTKPTPINNILWFATIKSETGYYLGYYSLLDNTKDIQFKYFDNNHYLLDDFKNDETLKRLLYIAKGYYVIEASENKLLLHDLRFGQMTNFETGEGKFVFSYFLEKETVDGEERVKITSIPQNPKDIKKEMFFDLWKRVKGI